VIEDRDSKYKGLESLHEWLNKIPNEMEWDDVFLSYIILIGKDSYSLSGIELAEFVRQCIINLVSRGGVPSEIMPGNKRAQLLQYGNSPEEIADAVVSQWQKAGGDRIEMMLDDDIGFVLKKSCER